MAGGVRFDTRLRFAQGSPKGKYEEQMDFDTDGTLIGSRTRREASSIASSINHVVLPAKTGHLN